eukprot:1301640-Amorphochlora_amoeboformis.AAC.1
MLQTPRFLPPRPRNEYRYVAVMCGVIMVILNAGGCFESRRIGEDFRERYERVIRIRQERAPPPPPRWIVGVHISISGCKSLE